MSKDAMRQAMPTVAQIVDEYRPWLGKVIYASENGNVLDRRETLNEGQVFVIPQGYCKPYTPKEKK
jgi:hypothetical protein